MNILKGVLLILLSFIVGVLLMPLLPFGFVFMCCNEFEWGRGHED